ncbi:PREDICTED: uncharacterized protein LOC109238311 [Nicotiana attenuata]|uniref:Uncharacterized protein n=1 Tax=Nicotiana attenuata TaxID=49451 RepID=A0A314LC31_NICAT|nr:PREDICTED: uncharacterized protein LOC109238311 [Nicotiana attenuata]XP_019260288.1 PREDICTED: uncharacterized protein LOC109238311 [Nicotiana attenuata]XP_019260289.1 PREDICTED: uncharacterized protein LOC109238311 [Nicotiana attenuata]OIT39280.1 hypothetical protein A4A49_33208 [Nicotiana attenuata]
MGGVCTGGTARNRAEIHHERSSGSSKMLKSVQSLEESNNDSSSSSSTSCPDKDGFRKTPNLYDSGELCSSISRELRPSPPASRGTNKAPSSFLGKASTVGLEKAVEVLDTLGSSMINLKSGGFLTGTASRENNISILAFEIANTITKGANLLQSLSEENVQYLKKEVLPSKGVQQLVSTNMKELLTIAADDKRKDFAVFCREVIRFGDMCKDPQWHNLGRYFSKLDMDTVTHKLPKAPAEMTMQELITLAQHTSELYHELHALDRFEQDHRRNLEEIKFLKVPPKGEGIMMLQSELKHQRKTVRIMKKKSLWFKSLEEVVEKLVDVVTFIHQEISEAFGDDGSTSFSNEPTRKPERLGEAGLALHYANLISQIDNIVLRPTSVPRNMRDSLYNGLPSTVKTALRSRLQTITNEELTIPQLKAEIGKTLQWLVPVATYTTRAHQGFGWVGEWANTGNNSGKKIPAHKNIIRLQTLYHADKQKMDQHIIELVTLLHRITSLRRDDESKALPERSPCKGLVLHTEMMNNGTKTSNVQLSMEDRNLLEEVMKRGMLVPGISKSQELVMPKKRTKHVLARSRSAGSSPQTRLKHAKANVLDVLDGLEPTF